jgi:hypothetical protein
MPVLTPLPVALQTLRSRPLFTLKISVSGMHTPGGPAGSERRVSDVPGGSFAGERLNGVVLAGGTDWQTLRGDGTILLDARIVLRTDDEALIAMSYVGIRQGPPEVLARLARGEDVDPASYYFRITPIFATSAPRYAWLNNIVAVGVGHRLPDGPVYSLFEIL